LKPGVRDRRLSRSFIQVKPVRRITTQDGAMPEAVLALVTAPLSRPIPAE